MSAGHRPLDDHERWEWLRTPAGWLVYEEQERVAIALESGVPRRLAADIAAQQVGSGGYSQAGRPW